MKKIIVFAFIISGVIVSCGPAAEDRFQMDRIAKRMSDSLAYLIDSSLNDPIRITNLGQNQTVPVITVDSTTVNH